MKHLDWLARVSQEDYMTVTPGVDPYRPENESAIGKLWNRMHPPGILSKAYALYGGLEDAEGIAMAEAAQDQAVQEYEGLGDQYAALEAYAAVLQASIDTGQGLHPQTQQFLAMRAPAMGVTSNLGLEDYSARGSREALYCSVEGFQETAKKVWEQMKRAFELLYNAAADLLTRLAGRATRLRESTQALLEQVKGQKFNVPQLEVKTHPVMFAEGHFVADDVKRVDTIFNYMAKDYYSDLEASYKQLAQIVQKYRPGDGTLHQALFADNPMRHFPGRPVKSFAGVDGKDLIVRAVAGMPGNKAFVATAPVEQKDVHESFAKLFNDFRIEIVDDAKVYDTPDTIKLGEAASPNLVQRLELLANRLGSLVEGMANQAKIRSIVDIVGHTAAELSVKIESIQDKPEEAREGMSLLKGLNQVMKNVAPNTNGIYSYLVQVYSSQFAVLQAQVNAQNS